MNGDELVTAFVTLFVIIDPIGIAPLFVALTRGQSDAQRHAIALRATLVAAGVLTVFGLVGKRLLEAIGIGMPAFAIAGGILLFLTALDMLFERRSDRREKTAHDSDDDADPSVFPLAIPLIAGPGALATMILLTGQHPGEPLAIAGVIAVMLAVLALNWLSLRVSTRIGRVLGRTGIVVVTRLFGMLLAALAVQFVLNGLRQQGLV